MSEPFEAIRNMDRLVHDPSRLAILTALGACRSADFMYLQALTGLSKGNLSLHLGKLEAHGLVAIEKIEKTFTRRTPRTVVRLTNEGKTAIRTHWRRLEKTRSIVTRWMMRKAVGDV